MEQQEQQMKKLILTILILAMAVPAMADTAMVQANERLGFYTVTLTVTAGAVGGALADEEIDLTGMLTRLPEVPWYFYWIETEGDAVDFTIKDADGGEIFPTTSAGGASKEYHDAAKALPNYWPVTGNIFLTLSDIGANNSRTFKFVFTR
jgi:hypothetical protein